MAKEKKVLLLIFLRKYGFYRDVCNQITEYFLNVELADKQLDIKFESPDIFIQYQIEKQLDSPSIFTHL